MTCQMRFVSTVHWQHLHSCMAAADGVRWAPARHQNNVGHREDLSADCTMELEYHTHVVTLCHELRRLQVPCTVIKYQIIHSALIQQANFNKTVMPPTCIWCIVCDSINRPGDFDRLTVKNRFTGYPCDGFHPANFGLPRPFRSRVRSRHMTDRQKDGRTDGQTLAIIL